MRAFSPLLLLALAGCMMSRPTLVGSAEPSEGSLEFRGAVVEDGPDFVRLADAEDPTATVRVRKELVTVSDDGKIFLRRVAVDGSSRERHDTTSPLGGGASVPLAEGPPPPHISAECRGIVRFRCNADQTSDPIGVCFGLHGCRDEEL